MLILESGACGFVPRTVILHMYICSKAAGELLLRVSPIQR
jgi:hypothetical protein